MSLAPSLVASLAAGVSTATASFLLFSLLIGGVVVIAALAAHDAQRAANRAVRWVWFSAIGAVVALSLAAPLRRQSPPTRIAPPRDSNNAVDSSPRVEPLAKLMAWWSGTRNAIVIPVEATLQVAQSAMARVPVPVQRGLAATWLLATFVTLGVFCISYLRVRRQMRAWPLQRIDDVTARIAPAAGPAVVGLAPSEIILPAWLLDCPAHEQRMVVAHESEHVRAGDPWLLVIACGAVACMPWHPALWFALGRLRLAIELDCDRRVLRRGIPAADYGSLLIHLSVLHPSLPPVMPAFSCNGSYLERRLVAMTSRQSRFARSRRIGSGLVAAVALITACESRLPTSADVERMDATTAERALVGSGTTRYVVDGKPVPESVAKAIGAERITTVAVAKVGDAVSEIRITTKDAPVLMKLASELEEPLSAKMTNVRIRRPATDSNGVVIGPVQQAKRKFDGLLIIDGTIVESSALERIPPEQIGSIEVLKGEAARLAYGDPRAANGVIRVSTKAKQ